MKRLRNLIDTLVPSRVSSKLDEDVVICSVVRTPITKAKRGGFKDTAIDHLLSVVLKEAAARAGVEPAQVEDIGVGNILMTGIGQIQNRMAMFAAGFPETTCLFSVNRQGAAGI